jgi:Phosphotransferase enzyme family
MAGPPPRIVTLVLVDGGGRALGSLPAFEVASPWWPETAPIVDGARRRFGVDVTVLRLLEAARPSASGGRVTYQAEVDVATGGGRPASADLVPWHGSLPDDPLRQSWARPGGPAADLAWADAVLERLGRPRTGPAEQIRSWNLSSLWRLPTADGAAWLKVVPPFFAHEGVLLEALAGGPMAVPRILGRGGPRVLLDEIPGDDRYDAPLAEGLSMVDRLVALQTAWIGRVDDLLAFGLPDWRAPALTAAIQALLQRDAAALDAGDREALGVLLKGLPARFAALDACGLPDTLVHGDFHAGNVRGDGSAITLLDWGDAGVGHPLLDQPAFLRAVDDRDDVAAIRVAWEAAWRRARPGSDPGRAARILAPVAAARQALVYRRFLDRIEATEQRYHQADVPDWLRRTAAIVRAEPVPDWDR